LYDVVAHDKAGERILEGLVESAEIRLAEEGIRGDIYLYRNNTDSAGNSYGCHENYLIRRHADFQKTIDTLIPYLVTRQIWAGAGKLLNTARGTVYSLAQRSEHIWESSSSATTRSRPIINTRDEPHADAEKYRRLHVIAGDSNMSEYVTYVKVGATVTLLQMLEDEVVFRDLTLENPIRAIREISHDTTCRRRVRLANGRELSALDIQWEYLERVMRYARVSGVSPEIERAISMWEHLLTGLEKDPLTLHREVDWVAKHHLMDRYSRKHDLPLSSPRLALIDLNYHDVNRERGLYYKMEKAGLMDRIVTDDVINTAMVKPPGTTRARLRGEFIRAAKAKRRDFTVDWVHLKLNDQAQRTVLCKDPFKAYDERVDRLIESL
jgi:proteasome accessory factor A